MLANHPTVLGRAPTASSLQIGNVDGPVPAASTDNAVVRWDGTTGRLIQNSNVTLSDAGALAFPVGTTSAVGITFGTDVNFYRDAAGQVSLNAPSGDVRFALTKADVVKAFINTSGNDINFQSQSGQLLLGGGSQVGLTIDAAKDSTFAGHSNESTDTKSGAGAISVTVTTTRYTSTGGAEALTLANGTNGQIKRIIHVVDGGSGVLTPATKTGYTTITFTNVGESATLQYVTTQGWCVVGLFGAVAA